MDTKKNRDMSALNTLLILFWDKIKVSNAKTATTIITIVGFLWFALDVSLNQESITNKIPEFYIPILKYIMACLAYLIAAFTAPRTSTDVSTLIRQTYLNDLNEFKPTKFNPFNQSEGDVPQKQSNQISINNKRYKQKKKVDDTNQKQ